MAKALASGGIVLPVIVALVLGPAVFATALTVVAVAVLVDLSALLTRAAARPILPAALVPAAGLPVAVALRPEAGWDLVPPFVAVGFLVTFLFALVFGRRRGIVQGAGTTMLAGLVVGLGAGSLVLLVGLPDGFRWALAFLLLAGAADLGAALPLRGGRSRPGETEPHLPGAVVAAAVVAVVLFVVLRPPLDAPVSALLTLAALTAAVGGAELRRGLVAEADVEPADGVPARGGALVAAFDALLLGAPLAYVLARSAAL